MPCFCGNKVERPDLKVLCIACKQFMHAECYKINKGEIELIKNKFKCRQCLTRRRSISDSLVVVGGDADVRDLVAGNLSAVDSSQVATASNEMLKTSNRETISEPVRMNSLSPITANSYFCNERLQLKALPAIAELKSTNGVGGGILSLVNNNENSTSVAINNMPMDADKVDLNISQPFIPPIDGKLSTPDFSKDCIVPIPSLSDIYNELISLKNDNKCLVELNVKLMSKVDELETMVRSLLPSSNLVYTPTVAKAGSKKLKGPKVNKDKQVSSSDTVDCEVAGAGVVGGAVVDGAVVGGAVVGGAAVAAANYLADADIAKLPSSNSTDNNSLRRITNSSFAAIVRSADYTESCPPLEVAISSQPTDVRKGVNPSKRTRQPVVGARVCDELSIYKKLKWLHLSSFNNTVEPADIVAYLFKYTEIAKNEFACYKLVKKDAEVKDLKFVNFKLGVPACHYDKIFNANIWPANIKVRPFDFLGVKPTLSTNQESSK